MTWRIFELDVLRGGAIILMIVFHFCFDLAAFGYADFNMVADDHWRIFRAIIVSCFLLCVGMSSYLAYSSKIRWDKFYRAWGMLLISAAGITAGSLIMYPEEWVYFGILHFIALSLVLSLWFVRLPKLSLVLGLLMISSYFAWGLSLEPLWQWAVDQFFIPPRTVDLVSFTPWFGVVLIGIYVMHKQLFGLRIGQNQLTDFMRYLGKHSLLIYLVHQPILYFGFSLVAISG